jgi:hypothetical protein
MGTTAAPKGRQIRFSCFHRSRIVGKPTESVVPPRLARRLLLDLRAAASFPHSRAAGPSTEDIPILVVPKYVPASVTAIHSAVVVGVGPICKASTGPVQDERVTRANPGEVCVFSTSGRFLCIVYWLLSRLEADMAMSRRLAPSNVGLGTCGVS